MPTFMSTLYLGEKRFCLSGQCRIAGVFVGVVRATEAPEGRVDVIATCLGKGNREIFYL